MSLKTFNPQDFFKDLGFQPNKMLVTEIMLSDGTFAKTVMLLDDNLDSEVMNSVLNQGLKSHKQKWFAQKTQGFLLKPNRVIRFENYVRVFSDETEEYDYEY